MTNNANTLPMRTRLTLPALTHSFVLCGLPANFPSGRYQLLRAMDAPSFALHLEPSHA